MPETAQQVKDFFTFFKKCLIIIIVLQVMNSAIDIVTEYNRQDSREGILSAIDAANKTLGIVEAATSPERQAENNERLNQVLIRIDCNNREALEEALIQLQIEVQLVGESC